MASCYSDFELWLVDKLKSLKTDENVFGSYISGILNGEETNDEKKDALEEILSEIAQQNISSHVDEIIEKWELLRPKSLSPEPSPDVDTKLVKLLESQTLVTAVQRKEEKTDDEKKIRASILSQYSQLEDSEDVCKSENDCSDLVKNTNAATVLAAAKERRELARQDAQRKKEKDKEDREKQKQIREEKKEKRKSIKGERRR